MGVLLLFGGVEGGVGGGGVKPCTHGNLVPLRRRGRLGEVCFLLDPENVSRSPSRSTRPLLFPARSLALYGKCGGALVGGCWRGSLIFASEQQDGDGEVTRPL